MRKLLPIVLCVALLTGCAGKQAVSAYMDGDVAAVSQAMPEGVSILFEWPEYSADTASITYLVTNNTDAEVTTGSGFHFEVYQDGNWEVVPMKENYAWTAEGIIIAPGTMRAFSGPLTSYDYQFHPGIYRITKRVGEEICTAEFTMVDRAFISADRPYGFGPLEEWREGDPSTVKMKAGVVTENADLIFTFLTKASLDMNCQLRVAEYAEEEAVTVTDVIYEKGRFLCRVRNGDEMAETYYSYLVTDGAAVYLSNAVDWEHSLSYTGNSLVLLCPAEEDGVETVAEMTERRLDSNVTRYKLWSTDGEMSAELLESPTEFSMGGIGYGATVDLQDMDGLETAVLDLVWDGKDVLLTCETALGETNILRASLQMQPLRIKVIEE